MPKTNTVTRTFNAPPNPIAGVDRFNLNVGPNESAVNVRIVVESRNGASVNVARPTSPEVTGPQEILIAWALAPIPGSHVKYRVEWEVQSLPVNPGVAVLFQHMNFGGNALVVRGSSANLDRDRFNDITSSLVIVSGTWMFFKDIEYSVPFTVFGAPVLLGPGSYGWVETLGIENDKLSSLRALI